ncbi:hypothetical protein [Priestia megaterium]|uniref:hypothetical protein n=1 Tax=Priestia megaterium TaxID=1404 RepID=UPI0015CF828E|nr:hypothetical protein [Priestia megaterium]
MTTHKEINEKYKQIESDISFFFSNEKKKKQIKEHLKGKTELFWDSINLINTLSQIDIREEDVEYKIAKTEICNKYINNSVVCLRLLEEGMYEDFFITLRQNIELSTLLNYFGKKKNSEELSKWIRGKVGNRKAGYIPPKKRREEDESFQTILNEHYNELSAFTHTKSIALGASFLGGYFDPQELDGKFSLIMFYIFKMLNYIISKIEEIHELHFYSILDEYESRIDELTDKEAKLYWSFNKYLIVKEEIKDLYQ